ncbi:MAG: 4-hydroxyphenylacetate 3-hydroxylase family protein [Candidatus Binatia bacterium]
MGIRTGTEFIESLRDERTIYVNGERLADVTTYPPFQGIIATLGSLYDLNHQRQAELTFASPADGAPVALSFLLADTLEQVEQRLRAEEIRAEYTFGLMGRLPDFCNAYVTDLATAAEYLSQREPGFGQNALRYWQECRDGDLCLTHTLADPQIDRSKGPAAQSEPFLTLRVVRETDGGVLVRGAKMLSTLAPFANELYVGPFMARAPGEEDYALAFALPCATPGLKFICREPYDAGRSHFDRPVSSRFDEEDALAIFDNVLVPWERMFIYRDIAIFNTASHHTPGFRMLQALVRGMVKLKLFAGLAFHIADAIGRSNAAHVQAQLGELVANVGMMEALIHAGAQSAASGKHHALYQQSLAGALMILMPQFQLRAVQAIKELSGSGMIMTPTEKDFANPEIADYLNTYLQGKGVSAKHRVQLFKLAWDLIGDQFGSRQAQYEYFYAGDPYVNRTRFYHSPVVQQYKALVAELLEGRK